MTSKRVAEENVARTTPKESLSDSFQSLQVDKALAQNPTGTLPYRHMLLNPLHLGLQSSERSHLRTCMKDVFTRIHLSGEA